MNRRVAWFGLGVLFVLAMSLVLSGYLRTTKGTPVLTVTIDDAGIAEVSPRSDTTSESTALPIPATPAVLSRTALLPTRRFQSVVTGFVRFDDGRPASGASVTVRWESLERMLTADADGAFRFERNWDTGTYAFSAVGDGLRTAEPVTLRLEDGRDEELLLVLTEPCIGVSGRIVDVRGMGLSGVTVRVTDGTEEYAGETGDDGRFFVVVGRSGNYGLAGERFFYPLGLNGSTDPIRIRVSEVPLDLGTLVGAFDEGDVLTGTVTTDGGEPVVGARVLVSDPVRQFSSSGLSAEDGSFRLERLPVGVRFDVRVQHDMYGETVVPDITTAMSPLSITLAGLRTVTVHVVDQTGNDVEAFELVLLPGAKVMASATNLLSVTYRPVSAPIGRVTLTDLEAKPYTVAVRRAGSAVAAARIEADVESDREITIELAAESRIVGTVMDAEGASVPSARVAIAMDGQRADRRARERGGVVTDDAGHYTIEHVVPGQYTLIAQSPVHAPVLREVTVGEAEIAEADIVLGTVGGSLDVRITRDGEPVAGELIWIRTNDNEPMHSTPSQVAVENGHGSVTGLVPAVYDVLFRDVAGQTVGRTVRVELGIPTAIEFDLTPGDGVIEGAVDTGEVVMGHYLVFCSVEGPGGGFSDSEQFPVGSPFRFEGVRSGNGRLQFAFDSDDADDQVDIYFNTFFTMTMGGHLALTVDRADLGTIRVVRGSNRGLIAALPEAFAFEFDDVLGNLVGNPAVRFRGTVVLSPGTYHLWYYVADEGPLLEERVVTVEPGNTVDVSFP